MKTPVEAPSILRFGILIETGLGLSACLVGMLLGRSPLGTLAFNRHGLAFGVLATLPLLLLLVVVMASRAPYFRKLKEYLLREVRPLFLTCGPFGLALLSICAGFGEETLFRGLLQGELTRLVGPAAALLMASLLFGLAHPFSVAYVLSAALIGSYLGFCWKFSGNLLVPMIAHALYDYAVLLWLVQPRPGLGTTGYPDKRAADPDGSASVP